MASKGHKGALLDTSLKRLKAAMQKVATVSRIDAVEMPTDRDPELQTAMQVEAFANWADSVVAHFGAMAALTDPEKVAGADNSTEGKEPVENFNVDGEGVITANTPEGPVTSAGQDTPEDEKQPEPPAESKAPEKSTGKKAK